MKCPPSAHARAASAAGASGALRGLLAAESPRRTSTRSSRRKDAQSRRTDHAPKEGPMSPKYSRALMRGAAVASVVAGAAAFASPAMATSTTDTVIGTAQPEIAIAVSTPASAFTTGFQPGGTANSSGALLVTDTSATPSLTAVDATSASNKGHMQAAAVGCTGSASALSNP